MLLLAKAAGIAILVWFYLTAKNHGEAPVKWAVIGVMGYWIAWWAIKLTVVSALSGLVAKSGIGTFLSEKNFCPMRAKAARNNTKR